MVAGQAYDAAELRGFSEALGMDVQRFQYSVVSCCWLGGPWRQRVFSSLLAST